MSDTAKRYTFNLRKTTTSATFQIPINIEEAFKNIKPPVVPSLFRSVCEEILARIASRQLSILPSPLSVLFFNADSMSENAVLNAEIDDVIKMLHFGKKGTSGKQRALKRWVDLQPYRTSVLIRALFRYAEDCSDGIHLNLEIPEFGYLLTGPPPLKADTKPDMRAYTRTMDTFLLVSVKRSPVKRDIFCYLMTFLSQIYQLMRNSYRSEPALCGMTRYILANRFGAEMIAIICTDCNTRIEMEDKGCSTCTFIKAHIKPPYYAQVFDMMLEYIPLSYWREALNNPRRGLADKDKISTRISDLQFIVKYGNQGDNRMSLNAKLSQESADRIVYDMADDNGSDDNRAAIKSQSAPPKNMGSSESRESRQESSRQIEVEEREVETNCENGEEGAAVGGKSEAISILKDSKSSSSVSVDCQSPVFDRRGFLNGKATSATVTHKSPHTKANQSTLFSHPSPQFKGLSEPLKSEAVSRVADSSKMTPKKDGRKTRTVSSRTRKSVKRSVSNKKKKKIRNGRRVKRRRPMTPKIRKGKRKKGKAEKRSRKRGSKTPRSKTKSRGRSRCRQ